MPAKRKLWLERPTKGEPTVGACLETGQRYEVRFELVDPRVAAAWSLAYALLRAEGTDGPFERVAGTLERDEDEVYFEEVLL